MAELNFDPSAFVRPTYDALPDIPAMRELKTKSHWVSWGYKEVRDKEGKAKWTKPPSCPHNGLGASVSNPKTWGTYDEAVLKTRRSNLAGVGFVLAEQDEFSGADLDHCRDAETGELEGWAADVVRLAETYVEVSPSGEGLRILWRGKVAATFKHDPAQVEVYRSQRYLTITGDHVEGTPTEILPAPKTEELLRARVAEFKKAVEQPIFTPQPTTAPETLHSLDRRSDFFRRVNSAALADLPAWVPGIFSDAKYQPGTKAFRISSRSLGRDLEEDLSISPSGIVDFGVADMGDGRQGKRTPIDVVIEYGSAPDATAAAFWLCDQIGRTRESLGWQDNAELGAEIANQLLSNTSEKRSAPARSAGSMLDDFGPAADWTRPQGLLADLVDWIMLTSRRPNRPLAVAAATATLSALCGRHLYGPTGTALNLYIVCLAGTSVGKGRPLSAIGELLHAAKLPSLHTTAKGFSVSAIEQMVVDHPCCVATVDEIGANLLGRMSHKNSNSHELGMRGALLELWSREQGMAPFATHRRATSQSIEVPCPSISLFGVSTPEAFYGAVTAGSVKDGFLNRFLLVQAAQRAKPHQVSEEDRRPPQNLLRALQAVVPQADGALGAALGVFSLSQAPTGVRIEWANGDVRQAAEDFEERLLEMMDANAEQAPLLGRVFEYAVRLASLHAVSRAGGRASANALDWSWGASWALQSARMMMNGAIAMMATNDYEQKFNAIRSAFEEAGWMSKNDLLRRIRHVNARERDEIVKHLRDGGWIEVADKPSRGGRPAVGWKWVG